MFSRITGNFSNLSLALGFFDGVHIAHQKVILNAVGLAKRSGGKSAVITFNNHPAEFLGQSIKYLMTTEERNSLIKSLGVDYIFSLDFDEKIMNTDCEDYLRLLVDKFHPYSITTGFNHTFGKSCCGTPDFLQEKQREFGYIYCKIPPERLDGEVVSSTFIRKKLTEGDVVTANRALGREFSISGNVVKGNQLGRTIGFPTANIIYPDDIVEIPFGVYSAEVSVRGRRYKSILNYGVKPSVSEFSQPVAEAHILGFDEDIYGEEVVLFIKRRLRGEKKFGSLKELKTQIVKDIEEC